MNKYIIWQYENNNVLILWDSRVYENNYILILVIYAIIVSSKVSVRSSLILLITKIKNYNSFVNEKIK